MKTLATMTALWVVLGLCLPSYAEILVYKATENGNNFTQAQDQWVVERGPWKGYMVIEIDYQSNTITQAGAMEYGRDADGHKYFKRYSLDLELVQVDDGTRVRWIVMQKSLSGVFYMLTGLARDGNVGTGEAQEVASRLTGYGLVDQANDGQRAIGMTTLSLTFYRA
jgi:hypothetical protein